MTNPVATPAAGPSAGQCPSNRKAGGLLALLVLALVLRLSAVAALADAFADDPDSYAAFAHTWRTTGTLGPAAAQPSAYRPPLYPALLVPWCRQERPAVGGVVFLHAAATCVTIICSWHLAQAIGAGRSAGLAALIVALDPLSIRQFTLLMSETVFTAGFAGLLLCWVRGPGAHLWRWRGGVGGLVAFCALVRPTVWCYWLATGLVQAIAGLRRWPAQRCGDWFLCSLLAGACCLPWALRNWTVFGRPIITTTHGGYTLWLGQNPVFYDQEVTGAHAVWPPASFAQWQLDNDRDTAGMAEVERDAFFRQQALAWMRAAPAKALKTMLYHVRAFWSPVPRTEGRWIAAACALFYPLLYLLALVGACRPAVRRRGGNELLLAVLSFTLLHAVYWSNIRMRTPLIPVLAVLAAAARPDSARGFVAAPKRKQTAAQERG